MDTNMVRHLARQLAYDDWANRAVIAALQSIADPPPRALRFMAHIVGAEWLWLSRMTGETSPLAVWPELTAAECSAHTDELRRRWQHLLRTLTPDRLGTPISYTNSKGEPWTSAVGDILTHVVMHSAYHRGQIATDMRAAGHTPIYTDFIHAVRQGEVE